MTENNFIPFDRDLRKELFNISEGLDGVLDAYDSLQVLSNSHDVESYHSGSVLIRLNDDFRALLNRLRAINKT